MLYRDPEHRNRFTFACTLGADCPNKTGMRTLRGAYRHQRRHDAKHHLDHKFAVRYYELTGEVWED
jgi:hypothetical protein